MISALFDTCVVIDLLQKREPFFEDAHALFLAVANERIQGVLSSKTVLDVYYIMHHANHSAEKTREVLNALFSLFTVADTTAEDCRKAVLSGAADYEDAVLAETAKREGVSCIVTRNLTDFAKAGVTVRLPEELRKQIGEQKEGK